jgi:ferric-dicitrate binding protein FerR (iron transport regulator)
MDIRPRICERAAHFVSLELDGELSLFERTMLKRHLQRCERCAAYARDVTAHTQMLRAAPLEEIRLPMDFSLQRRRVFRVLPSIAATAAVAAVGIWFAFSSLGDTRVPANVGSFRPGHGVVVRSISDDRYDWPAGLPRTAQVIELGPGSLYTGTA